MGNALDRTIHGGNIVFSGLRTLGREAYDNPRATGVALLTIGILGWTYYRDDPRGVTPIMTLGCPAPTDVGDSSDIAGGYILKAAALDKIDGLVRFTWVDSNGNNQVIVSTGLRQIKGDPFTWKSDIAVGGDLILGSDDPRCQIK